MNNILCIGEALIDMICTDRGSQLSDGNNFVKKPGGAPTNVAAAIGALGGNAWLAAMVGVDPFGDHLIDIMKGFNVQTKFMLQSKTSFTTFAFVSLLHSGERDFYFNRGADGQLSTNDVDDINMNDFTIAHFGSATAFLPGLLQAAYKHTLLQAKASNSFISFDPNYRHLLFQHDIPSFLNQSWDYLHNCHFFKVSDEEALMLTDTTTVADAAKVFIQKTTAIFAITIGKEGTLLGHNGNTTIIESIEINAVDTTGAGDAFVGAVLFQLSKLAVETIKNLPENEWQKIIKNANIAGARTCEYVGAMEAFKQIDKNIFN